MSISGEKNVSLGVDTDVLREAAGEFMGISDELKALAKELDECIAELKDNSWTTGAGKAFHEMTKVSWEDNIIMYTDLMKQLATGLMAAANQYDGVALATIENTHM